MRALLIASLGLSCCSCATIPEFSHKAVLTPQEQAGLGAVAVTELLGTSQLAQDQEQAAVTLGVGRRLADASGRDDLEWDFKVVQHPRPIAVALPDGTVIVTDSLLARCRSEAELAAVMAREMGCMLAGVYPREVLAPISGQGFAPLDLARLTPADQSAKKTEDIQAADSIGLSLLVTAGYDPSAATNVWLQSASVPGPDGKAAFVARRRDNEAREQALNKFVAQARSVYQSHAAKLGAGNALAFTAAGPQPHPNTQTALTWTAPAPTPVTTPAPAPVTTTAPGPVLSVVRPPRESPGNGNSAVFSSDGEFLPPTVASDRPGDGRWSSAPATAEAPQPSPFDPPPEIQQTAFEQFAPPTTTGPVLP